LTQARSELLKSTIVDDTILDLAEVV